MAGMAIYGELYRAQLEYLGADPAGSPGLSGRMWYRSDLTLPRIDRGASVDSFVLAAATQTLTNKTLDTANNTVKSGAATANYVLTADGAGNTSWAAQATAPDSSAFYTNGSIAVSVAANACTIALKDKSGSNASGSSVVQIGFRNATAATGTYAYRSVTAALSITIPSGTTIGTANGITTPIYVYAIDNAGTVELAVSLSPSFDEGSIVTTTAISGGSSATTIYSTTARTGVAVRLIGRFIISEATAGTWASSPTEVSNIPFRAGKQVVIGSQQSTSGTTTSATYATLSNTPTVSITAQRTGTYRISCTNIGGYGSTTGLATLFQIAATSGSPTVLVNSQLYIFTATGYGGTSGNIASYGSPFILVTLIAGSAYTFSVQGQTSSGTLTARWDIIPGYLIAEEM